MAWRRRGWQAVLVIGSRLGSVVVAGLVTGCSLDSLLNSDKLPADVSDPAVTQTAAGARSAYNGTVAAFRAVYGGVAPGNDISSSFVAQTGLLSDELKYPALDIGYYPLDQRALPEGTSGSTGRDTYVTLQKVRNQARQAIGLLRDYLPAEPALASRLYALQGYTELFLAELYCSGIPLSTLDYGGDYTYRPGSSTAEVLTQAVALFDTALALAGDSARFADLARVGQGRALLGLESYTAAATAVSPVADGYRYTVDYNAFTTGSAAAQNFARIKAGFTWEVSVPDREGVNGLDWRTSGDPRTMVDSAQSFDPPYAYIYHPTKYAATGDSAIVLASGVEARLIEAEAALQAAGLGAGGTWLATLNALRTDGTFDTTATSPPDTLWHAGAGGVAGLAPLTDPGTADGRVNLLFRERAFWLYLTGHRQGDLRRLIRQYGRQQGDIYPVGTYGTNGLATLLYGTDVEIPTPEQNNPLYTGCASRGA